MPPWASLASEWQKIGQEWLGWWARAALAPDAGGRPGAAGTPAIDPQVVVGVTERYAERFQELWRALASAPADAPPDLVPAPAGDRRFSAREWHTTPYFSWLRQTYLLYGEYLRELAAQAQMAPADRRRLEFMTRQYLDAIAPTNYPATNPAVLKKALETEGSSLVHGLSNLVTDVGRGRITMSDQSAFGVGKNLAVTPGSVVFRNDLIEVLQYDATTPTVHKRPLVIIPPCINKYYILDLRPANSLVRYCVAQGHTTFVVSWRNIPPDLGRLTWDDYLESGVLQAIDVAQRISGSRTVNALGFCVGGTLLASVLAVLAARNDHRVESVTLLTTMLDFADPGEIGVYVSREYLSAREPALLAGQRLLGSELATAFASLRANDLVWNYVVNNYLKGETPPAFDLLYWNNDPANLAGPMYAYYLRLMYVENELIEPGKLTMLGHRVDLGRIALPVYVMAAREDHIVPWRSAYRTTTLVNGDVTFVLGASGHIAGVVNPPEPARRSFWTNALLTDDPDDWMARAESVDGSWWPHWAEWLQEYAGPRRAAPAAAGSDEFPPLDPAPGTYVTDMVA